MPQSVLKQNKRLEQNSYQIEYDQIWLLFGTALTSLNDLFFSFLSYYIP